MAMPVHDKLIRDKVPAALDRLGVVYRTRTLDSDEYHSRLLDKLDEETAELRAAASEEEQREELADVLEVVLAIAELLGGPERLERTRAAKAEERGGFAARLLLEETV
jgi:predicted house-cleaning noncanonical NTP pyrophosphatase (MazG superfamily)